MPEEPVTIVDRDVLKVLSNETRMDILKLLSEGGRNPSFVAKKLKKSDATIVEHLQTLEKVGLVKRTASPGKKWVFYSLTRRGEGIVKSKSRRLVIILSTSLVGIIAGAGMLASSIYTSGVLRGKMLAQAVPEAAERAVDTAIGTGAGADSVDTFISTLTQSNPYLFYGSIILIVVSMLGLGFYFYKKSNLNQRLTRRSY